MLTVCNILLAICEIQRPMVMSCVHQAQYSYHAHLFLIFIPLLPTVSCSPTLSSNELITLPAFLLLHAISHVPRLDHVVSKFASRSRHPCFHILLVAVRAPSGALTPPRDHTASQDPLQSQQAIAFQPDLLLSSCSSHTSRRLTRALMLACLKITKQQVGRLLAMERGPGASAAL